VLEVLTDFVAELRRAGLPVSLTEAVDAANALGEIDVADRPALRSALGATLVKSSNHWPAFEIASTSSSPAGLAVCDRAVRPEPDGARGGRGRRCRAGGARGRDPTSLPRC